MREIDFDPSNQDTIAQMRRIPAFSTLAERHIQEMLSVSRMRSFEPGETLITEGEYDGWVYFLVRGELAITHKGVEVGVIRRLGDVFGEMGIIDGSPRSATIKALARTLCVAVDASLFDRLKEGDRVVVQAIFYRIFCEILATRLREMDERLAELSKRHI